MPTVNMYVFDYLLCVWCVLHGVSNTNIGGLRKSNTDLFIK